MEFKLAKVSGLDDAIISLLVSKRNFDEDKCQEIRSHIYAWSGSDGALRILEDTDGRADLVAGQAEILDYLDKLCKYGLKLGYKKCHETILRFIDFTVETRGLHKAAMGDLDAHAQRMNNRIVRASSRLAGFSSGEKSEYYQDKILTVGEVDQLRGTETHDFYLSKNGLKYRFNGFGYVREDCWNDQDVQRGTYMLSIPSDAIWKCNFVDLKHIYAMRNQFTHAHPELQDGMEQLADQIEVALPVIGYGIRNEWVGDLENGSWVHVDKVWFANA